MQSPEKAKMSLVYVDEARTLGKLLEDRRAARYGTSVEAARHGIAREIGVAPGTLRNLRKRRLKDVGAGLLDSLRTLVASELQGEMRRLEHEIKLVMATGAHPDSGAFTQAAADLAKVRNALGLSAPKDAAR
jgi:hypothetical protein